MDHTRNPDRVFRRGAGRSLWLVCSLSRCSCRMVTSSRRATSWYSPAAGVILFSLFVGVVMLPILLQHIEVADHSQQLKEERIARAATAEVAIVAIQKMEERLAADTEENIDNQLLTEVSSRVIGNLRRRADGRNDVESSVQEENLERRFRLAALRSERAELYHLRATREISNETLQKLLHDLDLLEALLIEENQ